ncbi:MAG: protease complex subunit PrcB family protein [Bacteroidota bacterium]
MSQTPVNATEVSFTDINKDSFSGLEQAENLLIDNTSDWAEFWSKAYSTQTPKPELPEIDFSNKVVLAACMGSRNSGGYGIEILKTTMEGETVYVDVVQVSPGINCLSTMAIIYPYHVIELEKGSIKKAIFHVEERVNDCK